MSLRNETWPAKRHRRLSPQVEDDFMNFMDYEERQEYYRNCWPPLPEQLIEDLEEEFIREDHDSYDGWLP